MRRCMGFRDQLQDVANLSVLAPHTARIHIIRAASQFIEGDVLHWWHNLPKNGGGKKEFEPAVLMICCGWFMLFANTLKKQMIIRYWMCRFVMRKAPLLGQQEQDRYVTVETSDKKSVFGTVFARLTKHIVWEGIDWF